MAKPKKYDHVINSLPRLRGAVSDDPGYQGKVENVKLMIREPPKPDDLSMGECAVALDEAEAMLKNIHRAMLRAAAGKQHASEYMHTYLDLRHLKDVIAAWLGNTNLLLEAYTQLMVDQMEVESVGTLKGADGRGVSTYLEPYPTVEDKEAFRLWCLEQGFASLMQLHPGTTKSTVKKMLENGEPLPPGVKAWAKPTVRLVGGKE